MQKEKVPNTNRWYWIGNHPEKIFLDLPVFTEKEIKEFRKKKYTVQMFLLACAERIEGAAVESEKISPREDLGYTKILPTEELAKKYSAKISEIIKTSSIKGIKNAEEEAS